MPAAQSNDIQAARNSWEQVAAAHFPPSETVQPRTLNRMFVSHKEKLLYVPIAKCACTSAKRMMVELSALPDADVIMEQGVHRVADNFKTGAKLNDYDSATIEQVLRSDDYFKFTIIRDPIRRLISAYTEKFLYNRNEPGNQVHTLHPLQTVRCTSQVDFNQGISFRDFAEYLLHCDPMRLDTHWAPQHMFLPGIERYDQVYTTDQLDVLSQHLSERAGRSIMVGKHNISLQSQDAEETDEPGCYVDLLPSELDGMATVKAHHFMATDLVERLTAHYSEDADLFLKAREGLGDYRPPPLPSGPPPLKLSRVRPVDTGLPLWGAPDLALGINLFSKGFFALSAQAQSQINVMLANKTDFELDFSQIPSSHLTYTLYDRDNKPIHSGTTGDLALRTVSGKSRVLLPMEFQVPEAMIETAHKLQIGIRLGDAFDVSDISPLHLTVAHRVALD